MNHLRLLRADYYTAVLLQGFFALSCNCADAITARYCTMGTEVIEMPKIYSLAFTDKECTK